MKAMNENKDTLFGSIDWLGSLEIDIDRKDTCRAISQVVSVEPALLEELKSEWEHGEYDAYVSHKEVAARVLGFFLHYDGANHFLSELKSPLHDDLKFKTIKPKKPKRVPQSQVIAL